MKLAVYQANGFYLLNGVGEGGLREYGLAAVSCVKGDYLIPDAAGNVTNTATAVQAAAVGIAAESVDNSAGAAGAKKVKVIPLDMKYQFSVPVEAAALVAGANVGDTYDLESNGSIDLSDTAITAGHIGFMIDDFDASAEAVSANTYGYAIGHFQVEE